MGKGVCDEKVRLEDQTFFRRGGVDVWARDYPRVAPGAESVTDIDICILGS